MDKQVYKHIAVKPETKREFDMIRASLQISHDELLEKLLKMHYKKEGEKK